MYRDFVYIPTFFETTFHIERILHDIYSEFRFRMNSILFVGYFYLVLFPAVSST